MTTARRCMCGAGRIDAYDDGDECARRLGRRYYLVTIVQDSERGSAAASGAYTSYGDTASVPVSAECWRGWVRDFIAGEDEDFCRVDGPAAFGVVAAARNRAAAVGGAS